MERMTLREAAQHTARSITTLRRYIRSGRLHAEKRFGRFGPEYYLSAQDLRAAGLTVDEPETRLPAEVGPVSTASLRPVAEPDATQVPLCLYQELQMKHEQLLVQYGMIRAAGMRSMDLQNRLNRARAQLEKLQQRQQRREDSRGIQEQELSKQLREAHLELEGRALEIVALKEKIRGLEMLTRNEITNETIDKQFSEVVDQSKRLRRMAVPRPRPLEPTDDA
ncbi:MAG: hypothetical protein GTN89_11795 [Acidobacteria bacterium]|nr:hypothetical protein [Acidobacteriota bacterium]NIM60989.1 hypothetical protein [Acidobacteriota bacterium]NIO59957.1 hypothetical protein [Acidobacteriota bacterium]NIQ31029.1 hypothetical protein [Acidobacteriota bacterium]NIQ86157.1 hypothetical protein [Acidobacteriota bacterium]